MRSWILVSVLALGCAAKRPPPLVCEPPPPEPKKHGGIGSCPIDWGHHDAGIDAQSDAPGDADAHD